MEISKYIIVTASTIQTLQELVSEKIKKGYVPQGGVCKDSNSSKWEDSLYDMSVFMQAMIKKEIT